MGMKSMAALRAQRAAAGLVQVQTWIRKSDTDAFRIAVARFQQAAGAVAGAPQAPPSPAPVPSTAPPSPAAASALSQAAPVTRLCRVRFAGHMPPDGFATRMQAGGWEYDDASGLWSGRWPDGADPNALKLIEDLRACRGASVFVSPG